ncbi:hypothetical protein MLD38_008866 [Melastoma candidum]|uniref:Uncharacterized protein n=1 Tax=Melastoma candidum TaxID=119954 RepID=A0ACB9RVP3_9MYRT|nr:hypothetical protein MLD38_008866 [Melastoma candidum]
MLFLPGFGVGSFHYEKQLKDLGRGYRVWSLDFLGQGKSLPFEDPAPRSQNGKSEEGSDSSWGFGEESEVWASQLAYSIDLWQDQVRHFVEEVIKEPVYVVGNSLGGYVALYFAACYPHLVKGVMLLNATPFWGFLPNPVKSPRLARIFPWAGTFPLPSGVRKLTEIVWEKISDPKSIAEVLRQVYADHTINVDKVFSHILETTQHPAAAASFASIMFAPQGELSFGDSLSICKINNVPICLVYGKEDPWVKPIWGRQVKRQIPEAHYYEISPAGHCPHDEVPEVVNHLLRGWIRNQESRGSALLPLVDDDPWNLERNVDRDLEFFRGGEKKAVRVRTIDAKQPSSSGPPPPPPPASCSEQRSELSSSKKWCVYLILSTSSPLKTYVGATNDFPRRLRQHNGELSGGAKASRAGRPWVCACIIQGFNDQSEACEFESRWKIFSRKAPRRRSPNNMLEQTEDGSIPLLRHRNAALDKLILEAAAAAAMASTIEED